MISISLGLFRFTPFLHISRQIIVFALGFLLLVSKIVVLALSGFLLVLKVLESAFVFKTRRLHVLLHLLRHIPDLPLERILISSLRTVRVFFRLGS